MGNLYFNVHGEMLQRESNCGETYLLMGGCEKYMGCEGWAAHIYIRHLPILASQEQLQLTVINNCNGNLAY